MIKQIKDIAEIEVPVAPRHRMTYARFLEDPAINPHSEWVNGEVVEMPPVSDEHSDHQVFLLTLLNMFVVARDCGKVRAEPFQMKTGPDLPGRAPDILFVAKKNLSRLRKTFLEGPADLVIEIISPGTGSIDRGEKFFEYERGGVREYWLIDPIRKRAEFYVLRRKIFRLAEPGDDGAFHSTVLKGVWIKPEWLRRKPLPSVWEIARQWGLTT
jgi:Uma2 family endonuclease